MEENFPLSPFAKWPGKLALGNKVVDCYVLDTDKRVISLRASVKAITGTSSGDLAEYIKVKSLMPYINSELTLAETIEFSIPGTQFKGRGITTSNFLAICRAYVNAFAAGNLETDRQREIAVNCSVLLSACAEIGLDALIDEVTGYQYERNPDAMQVKFQVLLSDSLRPWEKTFPDELWEQFGRLTNWQGAVHSRPKWWGKLVMEFVYDALDPDIANYLRNNKPPPKCGQNYHQWFNGDKGLKILIPHIWEVIGIAKTCETIHELKEQVIYQYKGGALQQKLFKPKS